MKVRYFEFVFLLFLFTFTGVVDAQVTPFYTNSIDNSQVDEATERFFISDLILLPDMGEDYPLTKNVRSWAKDFFNSNTGMILNQETDNNYQYIEGFYSREFKKKTSPKNEKMGISLPLLYSNKHFVTYKALYGHAFNDITYKVDIATFVRNTGSRLSVKDIFKCDDNTIKKLMFKNLPKGLPCDIKSANEINIISAGINQKTIDVVGSFYKDNTAVYEIPFEDAEEYLTDNAYKMHGAIVTSKGTVFSDDASVSYTDRYFSHLLRNISVSLGAYHNVNLDKDFGVQLDKKYDFDQDGEIKSKDPKERLYIEIPSDDDNKEAYIEFSKSAAKSFVDELGKQLKDYKNWKEKMQSQNFSKYKLEDNGGGKTNVSFYRKDNNSYGYEEDMDYIYQFTYFKKLGTTAIVIKSGKKTGVVKKLLNLGSTSEKNINMELREDKLSGWTLILDEPDKEIPEICKAIQMGLEKMQ